MNLKIGLADLLQLSPEYYSKFGNFHNTTQVMTDLVDGTSLTELVMKNLKKDKAYNVNALAKFKQKCGGSVGEG